jgi:hypothetical protein
MVWKMVSQDGKKGCQLKDTGRVYKGEGMTCPVRGKEATNLGQELAACDHPRPPAMLYPL